jgi:hypothetical protein
MNFYEYYSPGDRIEDAPYLAAQYLIESGFKVLPCKGKIPIESIRSVNKLRARPIHAGNVDFYFKGEDINIAILTGDNLEVIDVDCKYDLTGSLYKQLALAIRYTLPDVWDKLVIQRTSSKGYHLIYRCPQIGGNTTLAQRHATSSELEKGERVKTLIETRGEGGYILIAPSAGYEFIKGAPGDIDSISIDERAELMAICRSFGQIITYDLTGISKAKQTDPESPWNVFNSTHDWTFIRDELVKAGWETLREDDDRVFILRPGAQSKTSGAIWKSTNMMFLFSTSTEFPERHPISPFDVVRYLKYDGDILKAARGLSEQGVGKFKKDEGEFYSIKDSGEITHSLRAIITWMHDIGIRRYFINEKEFEIVQVIDNKVSVVDNNYLKYLFASYVYKTCDTKIDEYFLRKFASIFSKENLINLIEKLEGEFLKSSHESAWLFYDNSAILITATEVKHYEYNSIPGLIWAKNVIKRKIVFSDSDCEAKKFIHNISKGSPDSFESAIGFMLHPFKDASNPKCVILYDEFYDETKEEREPEGGTGKGVFIKMLTKFRNTEIIDGKDFSNAKNFAYQQIGPETEIVAFEDVRKNFDFEVLFPKITDDWTVEKKNMGSFSIPFDRSPKIIITSNYPLRGTSKSHLRRRFELEVSSHYNSVTTIVKEFGHRFFYDWTPEEWNKFDNYFVECIQSYLRSGLTENENINLGRSRIVAETNKDFVYWIEKQTLPTVITKDEFIEKFTNEFPDYRTGKRAVTQALFTRWLKKWCDYRNKFVDTRNDYNGKMCYRFQPFANEIREISNDISEISDQQDELPF